MDNTIVHILVIWSKAQEYKDEILADLNKNFEILKVFRGHWDKEKFLQNYMVFYAHSQYHLDPDSYKKLLQGKVDHCGNDDFTVVILRDSQPLFEIRHTSSGDRLVNTRMFDKKTQYRTLTGGGHKIHSSDDAWETNHDLTLMFGRNTEDFLYHYVLDGEEDSFTQNCQGVDGYDTIEQLFYILNNTIRYVVLRNHECLPDQYTVEGHGDIDLLCEDRNWMAYLTGAKKIFPEPYRVYHTIRIGDREVPFDFRFVGDDYYDRLWEEEILANRQLSKHLFYVPSFEDQFYSLLYHAYIQKTIVKDDYLPKLERYGQLIHVAFNTDISESISLLDAFMQHKGYEYIRPQDSTVFFNLDNLIFSTHAFRYGKPIKRLNIDIDGEMYYSKVFEKENSFVKVGTPFLIDNEARFLNSLSSSFFPKLIRFESNYEEGLIEITRKKGVDFIHFFSNDQHKTSKYIYSFLRESLSILKVLTSNQIVHRDFIPQNLLIEESLHGCQVSLIDFGWAIYVSEYTKCLKPKDLAGFYHHPTGCSDFYSLGCFLNEYFGYRKRIHEICKVLCSIDIDDYRRGSVLAKKFLLVDSILNKSWSIADCLYDIRFLFIYRIIKPLKSSMHYSWIYKAKLLLHSFFAFSKS